MNTETICPICKSDEFYMVHGGYLCNSCESRFIYDGLDFVEVTDFISKQRVIHER